VVKPSGCGQQSHTISCDEVKELILSIAENVADYMSVTKITLR